MFSWCMFLPFCFDVGFVLAMVLFCLDFVFVVFLLLPSDYEIKHCFPCNASVLYCHVGFEVA